MHWQCEEKAELLQCPSVAAKKGNTASLLASVGDWPGFVLYVIMYVHVCRHVYLICCY